MRALGTLAALGVVSALAAALPGAAPARPALRVLDLEPLTVRGVRFEPRERVRLTVTHTTGVTSGKYVRARWSGRFTAFFSTLEVDRCAGGLTARARGQLGSRATAKLPQLQCPPSPAAVGFVDLELCTDGATACPPPIDAVFDERCGGGIFLCPLAP